MDTSKDFVKWNKDHLIDNYQEYRVKNDLKMSTKQIKYIQSLYNNIQNIEIKASFVEKISTLDQLEDDEIFKLVESLKRYSALTAPLALQILEHFDDDEIKMLSKKDFKDLTVKDAEMILKPPNKFNPWIREHPIISEDEWEYGWQESNQFENGKMMYLKFYNMLMLDLDLGTERTGGTDRTDRIGETGGTERTGVPGDQEKELINKLKRYRHLRFRLYKTYGGYHIFITSELINYRNALVFTLTKELGTDIYYSLFAYKTGFKIRLNRKLNRHENFVSEYLMDIGVVKPDPTCEQLIKIHDGFFE